jgi:hypothetical protein
MDTPQGIAWLAVALIPLMFEFVGLGTNRNDK